MTPDEEHKEFLKFNQWYKEIKTRGAIEMMRPDQEQIDAIAAIHFETPNLQPALESLYDLARKRGDDEGYRRGYADGLQRAQEIKLKEMEMLNSAIKGIGTR